MRKSKQTEWQASGESGTQPSTPWKLTKLCKQECLVNIHFLERKEIGLFLKFQISTVAGNDCCCCCCCSGVNRLHQSAQPREVEKSLHLRRGRKCPGFRISAHQLLCDSASVDLNRGLTESQITEDEDRNCHPGGGKLSHSRCAHNFNYTVPFQACHRLSNVG